MHVYTAATASSNGALLGDLVVACDDCGECGTRAVITQYLAAGDYFVVIDGFSRSSGAYNVTASCPVTDEQTAPFTAATTAVPTAATTALPTATPPSHQPTPTISESTASAVSKSESIGTLVGLIVLGTLLFVVVVAVWICKPNKVKSGTSITERLADQGPYENPVYSGGTSTDIHGSTSEV